MANETENMSGFSPIDFLRTRSLANVVQHEIERMIVEGEFTPNERINENALAQQLKVSRGPIREACSALAALGLIQEIPNRGFFVRELSEDEARDVSEARACIFACMTMSVAEKITDPEIAKLRALVDRMDELAKIGEVSQYYPVNLEFHSELARMCGNGRLAQIYLGLARELHIQRYRALASGDVLDISNREHRAIVEAVAARDPQRAFAAGREHIVNGTSRTRRATVALRHASD
ncbi:FCD domain-containing protein [Mesorhizobium sp. BR1-1-7]|uniref:FCD domain-containing protein n=1 Tax=Mesorhizobium sp. BR1-1-7 TaxID=2876647 RepID=UPI001CCC3084|nr:FCD domain-containing protein [Mesorhizobium sp. BR1-1-7]MBZ9921622.1 FCD domain-containing protein [Mesorhizobium sp. BR1-1-7]